MPETLAELRQKIAALEGGEVSVRPEPFGLGIAAVDSHLGGGLPRGALHEVYAGAYGDLAAASGFAAALAIRASDSRPLVWVRHRLAATETGRLDGAGLGELGLDPGRVILVIVQDGPEGLTATREALGCAALGAVVGELWPSATAPDLVATRRLLLAAGQSGVAGFLLRGHRRAFPSAALSRWRVRAAPSAPLLANAPGQPCFDIDLERHRGGIAPARWRVEWDRDTGCFKDGTDKAAALPHPLAAVSHHRPSEENRRRAG